MGHSTRGLFRSSRAIFKISSERLPSVLMPGEFIIAIGTVGTLFEPNTATSAVSGLGSAEICLSAVGTTDAAEPTEPAWFLLLTCQGPSLQTQCPLWVSSGHSSAEGLRLLCATSGHHGKIHDRFVGGEHCAPGHAGTTYGNLLSLRCLATDGFNPEGTALPATSDSITSGALSASVRPLRVAKPYVAGVPTT